MATLVYLYAIAPASPDLVLDDVVGIDAQPVRLVSEGELAAVVGDVASEQFGEGPLNQNVADLGWLGPRAVAHQQVTGLLFERTSGLLPLSFGTVFLDDQRVRRLLQDQRDDLLTRVEHVKGAAEWVAALRRDLARAEKAVESWSAPLRELGEQAASASPGRAYLLARQVEGMRRQELQRQDAAALTAAMDGLRRCARDTFREPLAENAVVEGVLARVSLLVDAAAAPTLLDTAGAFEAEWGPRGYSVDLTGPWPPYRFGGLPPAREAALAAQ